jgi:hypothetical protein
MDGNAAATAEEEEVKSRLWCVALHLAGSAEVGWGVLGF